MSVFVSFEVLRNSQKMDLTVLFTASKSRLIRNHNQNGICLVSSMGDKDHQGYTLVWILGYDVLVKRNLQKQNKGSKSV